jgi:hypothetical protein
MEDESKSESIQSENENEKLFKEEETMTIKEKKTNYFKETILPRLKQLYENDDWLANYIGIFFFLISFIPGLSSSYVGK